jgi:hypothetical protein
VVGLLPRALLRAVVGVVEALALEVHGDRVKDALERDAGLGVLGERRVGHPLHDLECRAVRASVLVEGHATSII